MDEQFFCQACLEDKPLSDSSPDPRYCHGCYDFLLGEKEILVGSGRHPAWIPKATQSKKGAVKPVQVSKDIDEQKTKMSILIEKPSTMDNFKPRGRPKTYKKRSLPGDKIKQLQQDGIGATAIASLLKREYGIDVSYKTIQRVLTGKRQ